MNSRIARPLGFREDECITNLHPRRSPGGLLTARQYPDATVQGAGAPALSGLVRGVMRMAPRSTSRRSIPEGRRKRGARGFNSEQAEQARNDQRLKRRRRELESADDRPNQLRLAGAVSARRPYGRFHRVAARRRGRQERQPHSAEQAPAGRGGRRQPAEQPHLAREQSHLKVRQPGSFGEDRATVEEVSNASASASESTTGSVPPPTMAKSLNHAPASSGSVGGSSCGAEGAAAANVPASAAASMAAIAGAGPRRARLTIRDPSRGSYFDPRKGRPREHAEKRLEHPFARRILTLPGDVALATEPRPLPSGVAAGGGHHPGLGLAQPGRPRSPDRALRKALRAPRGNRWRFAPATSLRNGAQGRGFGREAGGEHRANAARDAGVEDGVRGVHARHQPRDPGKRWTAGRLKRRDRRPGSQGDPRARECARTRSFGWMRCAAAGSRRASSRPSHSDPLGRANARPSRARSSGSAGGPGKIPSRNALK